MRSTLFYIPHQLGPLTVFGWGWMLIGLTVLAIGWGWFRFRTDGNWQALQEALPSLAIAAALIVFLIPRIETVAATPTGEWVIGLPIRGYGVMLMLGVLGGFGLAYSRAKALGITLDTLMSLAFWSVVSGIAGARIFFVVQKWEEIQGGNLYESLASILKFTEGGLVVYGSAIGGLIASLIWCRWKKLPFLAIADLIAPSFMLGCALGRIGCFLNGCCYGGVCDPGMLHVRFPSGSPVYMEQIAQGPLLGIKRSPEGSMIESIAPNSWAEQAGVQKGQIFHGANPEAEAPIPGTDPAGPASVSAKVFVDNQTFTAAALPKQSLPVHPSQIYSSVNAMLICLILYFAWPLPKRDGMILGIGLMLYAVSRSIEELIRVDEQGQFGTGLTISTWISLLGFALGLSLVVTGYWRRASRRFTWENVLPQ